MGKSNKKVVGMNREDAGKTAKDIKEVKEVIKEANVPGANDNDVKVTDKIIDHLNRKETLKNERKLRALAIQAESEKLMHDIQISRNQAIEKRKIIENINSTITKIAVIAGLTTTACVKHKYNNGNQDTDM